MPKPWILVTTIATLIALGIVIIAYMIPSAAKPTFLHTSFSKDSADDRWPSIAYGNGKWIVVWSSDSDLKGGQKSHLGILYSASSDGKIWSSPKPASADPALYTGTSGTPDIATDGKNGWAMVWSSNADLKNQLKDDFDLLMVSSKDNGKTWQALRAANTNAAADSHPQNDPTKKENDLDPRIVNNGGAWELVWWGNSKAISGFGCKDWFAPRNIYTQQSSDPISVGYVPWSIPHCVGTSETDANPDVAIDINSHRVLVFESDGKSTIQTAGKDTDILFAYSAPPALWSITSTLASYMASDNAKDKSPSIATDATDTWITVWSSTLAKFPEPQAENMGNDADLLFVRSTDHGKSWTKPYALNSTALKDTGEDVSPRIATDGKGNWVVVWSSTDTLGGTIGSDEDILVSASKDNGTSWSNPIALHDYANVDDRQDKLPRIATNGTQWVVVWESAGAKKQQDWDIVTASFTLPLVKP